MKRTEEKRKSIFLWRNIVNTFVYLAIFNLYLENVLTIGQLSWLVLIPVIVIVTNKKSKTTVFEMVLNVSYIIVVNTHINDTTLVASVTGALLLVYVMYFLRDFDR